MAETSDMILPLLREMRAEMKAGFDRVEARLEKLEAAQASFKQALPADTLMSKLVTGDFEQRIPALESQARHLQGAP